MAVPQHYDRGITVLYPMNMTRMIQTRLYGLELYLNQCRELRANVMCILELMMLVTKEWLLTLSTRIVVLRVVFGPWLRVYLEAIIPVMAQ